MKGRIKQCVEKISRIFLSRGVVRGVVDISGIGGDRNRIYS